MSLGSLRSSCYRKSRRLNLHARGNRDLQKMAGKRWTAKRCGAWKKDGGICQGRALENGRCKFHGGMSSPYHTRVIPPELIERIRQASRARMLAAWEAYREAKAKGAPLPRLGRKKRLAHISWLHRLRLQPNERRANAIRAIQEKWPDWMPD